MELKDKQNNKGRLFTPIDKDMIDQLQADGLKITRRCCQIQGYAEGRMYYTCNDKGPHSDADDLYWAAEHTSVIDLW